MMVEDLMRGSRVFHIIGCHADARSFINDSSYISESLDELGFETMLFNNPREYIGYVNNSRFEKPLAALINVSMPMVNGYEMLSHISTLLPNTKLVVVSREPETESEYIDLACMYLKIPFAPGTLTEIVSSLIRCHVFPLSEGRECASIDDRQLFPLNNWKCPHSCEAEHE